MKTNLVSWRRQQFPSHTHSATRLCSCVPTLSRCFELRVSRVTYETALKAGPLLNESSNWTKRGHSSSRHLLHPNIDEPALYSIRALPCITMIRRSRENGFSCSVPESGVPDICISNLLQSSRNPKFCTGVD